jgi:hypothetical protein
MLRRRIYQYAPEHWGKYKRAMIGVLAAKGRPVDRDSPFGLSSEVWVEDHPWPYVIAPSGEEARAAAVAIHHKPKLYKAVLDFSCEETEQEELVLTIVRRPDLKELQFRHHCTFSDEYFQRLGLEVQGLQSLVIQQRFIASPYCSCDACDIGVSRMIQNSHDTLQKLTIKMDRTERTLQAIRSCTNLKELEIIRSDIELIDLRFVPVETLTLDMSEPLFWETFFEHQISPSLRQLYLRNMHYSQNVQKSTELLYALCKIVHKVVHFYLGFITFPHDDFWTILGPAIQSSSTLTSFSITRYGSVFREFPGYVRTDEFDCILYTKIMLVYGCEPDITV